MERQKRKLKGIADLYNIEDERLKRQPSPIEDASQQNISSQDITGKITSQASEPSAYIPSRDISEQTTLVIPVTPTVSTSGEINTSVPQDDRLSQNVSHRNISQQDTFTESTSEDKTNNKNIIKSDISTQNTFSQNISENVSTSVTWSAELVDVGRGYFPLYNDITDRMIREMMLDVYEQSVLLKMYRDSRGWKSDECEISHAEIVRSCNISKSQSQRTLAKLASKGLIINLGRSKSGPERNRFRVLPGLPIVPQKNIFREDISREGAHVPQENMVSAQDISQPNTNKNNNKDLKNNTHTEESLCVCSKFSLEECRRYAEHLQKTGQGINNPGGYATAIFRSGEVDSQIEAFLNPPASSNNLNVDGCPDCGGSGYYYPEGVEKGVKLCKHEKLKGSGQK
jgi:hypothetical protein